MPRYQVAVTETNVFYLELDADSPEQAVQLADEKIGEADEFTDVVGECRSSSVAAHDAEELTVDELAFDHDEERFGPQDADPEGQCSQCGGRVGELGECLVSCADERR